ncbi:hypothetical protein S40285_00138 [Stachybotrys chlorohalonatus IBT 40285]|uniref:Histone-lysine N-methyltransferase, H3 lysine-36 specific n=1 Tax=Stachybotrys chlorohalonatus (strain IBT 40285) TaxID=1283841 RepID=A0A084QU38_STAC4|nr:hypothetical protein S40285_00138 [Stachybotrys chlorohalonata IBT 40285]
MEEDDHAVKRMGKIKLEDGNGNGNGATLELSASVAIPVPGDAGYQSPAASLDSAKSRSQSTEAPGQAKPPRLSRKLSQKPPMREPPLFGHLPDVTPDSCSTFQVIPDCLYGSKHLGATDNDAFDCDCRDEWQDGENLACGDDSDCINRATKMECSAGTGNCGGGCQNQRFQRKQYAPVSVIKTEKKGFGLRTDSDLHAHDFVFEYIGEVINEPTFRRRMVQYDQEGIKHFYFMSLNKSEFVDATKKGNLGRFCNHSCNPNCYVDKWVVGDKLRMGIFALRRIQAGEELVFNYNVDRYGADPQPCYCGESNCVGFIGGKTQTERSTKLPAATVEALGIDVADGWDTAVAKKPRKKRPEEDDEEYVNSIQARSLDEEDARKVMATLMQCKEKWIAVKLLERIQQCEDEHVIHCVMRMHAYQILKTTLNTFIEDHNVVMQVLSILDKFPRLTRNKIQDSKIDATIESLAASSHDEVSSRSKRLLDDWSKLEVAYRIRRRKFDPAAPVAGSSDDKKAGQTREEDTAQSTPKTASPKPIDAPKGPRNSVPQRNPAFFHNGPRPRRPHAPLPQGWFAAKDARGNTYFYDKQGKTTWQRPTQPPEAAQKGPSKAIQEQKLIQSIIDRVTKESTPKQSSIPRTSQPPESPAKDVKKDKWRSLPTEKQMRIYENTVFPPVKHVLDKFRHKLPKDELKRLGKEIAKKLVASDYKNNRVEDPTAGLTEKQVLKIKKYVKDFLDRAVEKYNEHQKRKPLSDAQNPAVESSNGDQGLPPGANAVGGTPTESPVASNTATVAENAEDTAMSDGDADDSFASGDRKRKREGGGADIGGPLLDGPDAKRVKEDETQVPSPPPPPPPPPEEPALDEATTAERQALREQEEALERENEEAQRLEDEANKTKRLEVAAAEAQSDLANLTGQASSQPGDDRNGNATLEEQNNARKQEVLSH